MLAAAGILLPAALGVRPALADDAAWTGVGDLTVGARGYWSSVASLAVSPSPSWSLDLGLGRGSSGTRLADSRRSLDAGGWAALGPDCAVTLRHRGYTGGPGSLVDPRAAMVIGEVPERETTDTETASLAVTAWRGPEGTRLESAWLRLDLGGSLGRSALPVAMASAPPPPGVPPPRFPPKPVPGTLRIDDHEYTGAITLGLGDTSLAVLRSLHYYNDRYESSDPMYARVPDEAREHIAANARTSLSDTIGGFPEDQLLATLTHRLAAGLTAMISYGRDRVLDRDGTVRTWSAELAWAPLDWLELKGGGSSVRAWGQASTYGTLGVTLMR